MVARSVVEIEPLAPSPEELEPLTNYKKTTTGEKEDGKVGKEV